MPLVYLYDRDDVHPIPEKDISDSNKLGYVIDVVDDCPVNLPPAEPFYIIKVNGVTTAQLRYLLQSIETPDPEHPGHTVCVRRKRWQFQVAQLAPNLQNRLQRERYLEIAVAGFDAVLKDWENP